MKAGELSYGIRQSLLLFPLPTTHSVLNVNVNSSPIVMSTMRYTHTTLDVSYLRSI